MGCLCSTPNVCLNNFCGSDACCAVQCIENPNSPPLWVPPTDPNTEESLCPEAVCSASDGAGTPGQYCPTGDAIDANYYWVGPIFGPIGLVLLCCCLWAGRKHRRSTKNSPGTTVFAAGTTKGGAHPNCSMGDNGVVHVATAVLVLPSEQGGGKGVKNAYH